VVEVEPAFFVKDDAFLVEAGEFALAKPFSARVAAPGYSFSGTGIP
jgi:hypothetical protein